MTEQQTKKVITLSAVLCLLAVAGLTLWAVWKTVAVLQEDEPLIFNNEKNLRELNKPSLPYIPEDSNGKG